MIIGTSNLAYQKLLGTGGDDVRNFEPTVACRSLGERRQKRLNFAIIDKSMQQLRAYYKIRPEWFETPKPKSDKGKNAVDYSVK
ncbi:MAG: hypothetical protein AAB378_00190 [Patescibacteria group bacterium]